MFALSRQKERSVDAEEGGLAARVGLGLQDLLGNSGLLDLIASGAANGRAGMGDLRMAEAVERRQYPDLFAPEMMSRDPDSPEFHGALVSRYDDLERAHLETGAHNVGGWAETNDARYDAMQCLLPPADTQIGDLDTPEQRLAVLNLLSQNRREDGKDEANVACLPTSMVAAAILGDGKAGLSSLLEGMRVAGNTLPTKERERQEARLAALRERLFSQEAGKQLTLGDLNDMSRMLYGSLKGIEGKDADASWKKGEGASSKAAEKLIDWSPGMKESMQRNDLHLRSMRPPSSEAMFHEVLEIGDGKGGTGMIYDPWARMGGQVVADRGQIESYRATF